MRGCRLLYFVKSKSGTKCKNFAVLLCFYVNTFILLQFLRWQEGGGATAPLATPLNPPLIISHNIWPVVLPNGSSLGTLPSTSHLMHALCM